MDVGLDKRLMLDCFGVLSSVSFVSAGSFFAYSPVFLPLCFNEHSTAAGAELFWSVLCSVLVDLSVEGVVVDFVFG